MKKKPTYEELESQIQILQQREVSLQESARRYRVLLDFTPYPVATFTLKGTISYVNPSFTDTFGWTLDDMKNGTARFIPPELAPETSEKLKELHQNRIVTRYVTKRLTKDGRVLDVIARGAVFTKREMGIPGELVIFRDITRERLTAKGNETMLRISMALPEYPDFEELLDYISAEIKRLLNTRGAMVILLDEERNEFFFPGAAYDDRDTEKRVKAFRFPSDGMASGRVIQTGEPFIANDTSGDLERYPDRDRAFGYTFENYVLVPIKCSDRNIGVLAAFNKVAGLFDQEDVRMLEMVGGTVGLSIENARFSSALKTSHKELASMNRAKSKAINHLSHELKTPVSVIGGSLNILSKQLEKHPGDKWKRSMERARRNMERIRHLQNEINDIILEQQDESKKFLLGLVDQCADLFEGTLEESGATTPLLDMVIKRINDVFGAHQSEPQTIRLDEMVRQRLDVLQPAFSHRDLELIFHSESDSTVRLPKTSLKKLVDGLVRNAVENTPDLGKIEILVENVESNIRLRIKDSGIGIIKSHQRRIFEGFFSTRETADYSSGRPFDFNAGGRGADLLRMKIFSERFGFDISMVSERCKYIPGKKDICPGDISKCQFCSGPDDCDASGGTTFSVIFSVHQ